MPVSPKDFFTVVGAGKGVDDVTWDQLSLGIATMARLHGM
jgi:hypothetical protein